MECNNNWSIKPVVGSVNDNGKYYNKLFSQLMDDVIYSLVKHIISFEKQIPIYYC